MSEGLKDTLKSITYDEKISKVDNSKIDEYLTELDKLESSSKQELQNLMKDYLINTLKSGYEINDKNDYEFLQKISTKFNLGISLPSFNDLLVDATFGIIFKLDENNTDIIIYSGIYKKRAGYIKSGKFIRDPGFFDTFGNNSTNDIKIDFGKIDEALTKNNSELIKKINSIKTLENLSSLITLLDKQNISEEIKSAIKTKVIALLTAGFESSKDIDDDLNNINRIIPLGVQGIGDEANKSIMFGRMYKLGNGKLEEINPKNQVAAQQKSKGTRQKTDTKTASSDSGSDDQLSQDAQEADDSKAEHDKKLQQRQNNQYYNENGAELKNNSNIIGEYTATTKINKRDIHGNDIGNVNKGETLKINGYKITLGGKTFYQAEGVDNKLFYVAADYLKKQKNESAEIDKKTSVQEYGTTETDFPEFQPYAPTITIDENGNEIKNSETDVERPLGKFSEINGNTLNQAIDKGEAEVGDITLKYLKNSDRIRFTLGETSFTLRISELSEKQGRKTVYLTQENLQTKFEEKYNTALSEQNTEKAETELSKIQEQVEKISMVASEFFVEPIQSHEQAWIDTLSGDEVTLNNISVTKDHNNNTIITFDIDDSGINDEINSNFVINLETSNFDELLFEAQLVKSVQKRIIPQKS